MGAPFRISLHAHNPREPYVSDPPEVPVRRTDKEIEKYISLEKSKSLPLAEMAKDSHIVSNACSRIRTSEGDDHSVITDRPVDD